MCRKTVDPNVPTRLQVVSSSHKVCVSSKHHDTVLVDHERLTLPPKLLGCGTPFDDRVPIDSAGEDIL